jgi:uncharacterized protein
MKIPRAVFQKLHSEIERPFISVLMGPRQVGKTFLLKELEQAARSDGLKTRFFNMEDPEDLRLFTNDEAQSIALLRSCGNIVFLDEFHFLKNATKIFKIIYDSPAPVKIFASGSSSIEMHRHLKESLAGRFRKTMIGPVCAAEYQDAECWDKGSFFRFGGMPGLVHEKTDADKMALLRNILETYLMKDIKALINEENMGAFNHLLFLLASWQGSPVPVASLAREIGLSSPTVQHYLSIMEATFVCTGLTGFSGNLSNEIKKTKKYYLYDGGLVNSITKNFAPVTGRECRGAMVEAFVLRQLLPHIKENMSIHFWRTRTGEEVDFVLVKDEVPYPIEVKYQRKETARLKGMRRFLRAYPKAPKAFCVTYDDHGVEQIAGTELVVLPCDRVKDMCSMLV